MGEIALPAPKADTGNMLFLLPLAEAVAGVVATFLFLLAMLATVLLAIRLTNAANIKKMKAAAVELAMDYDEATGEIVGVYDGLPVSLTRHSSDSSVSWAIRSNLKRHPEKQLLASDYLKNLVDLAIDSPSDFTVSHRTMTMHKRSKSVSDVTAGLAAFAKAGRFLSDDSAEGLIAVFDDQSGLRRLELLEILCELHRPDKRVEMLLKDNLKGPDASLMLACAKQLRSQGVPTLLQLIERDEWDPTFKDRVVAALQPHLDDRKVLAAVQRLLLEDDSPTVRQACAEMLFERGRPIPDETLGRMAERTAPEAVIAAELMGRVRSKPDVASLLRLAEHESRDVQEAAIESLGKVAGPEAIEALQSIRGRHIKEEVETAVRRIQMRSQGTPGRLSISKSASGGGLSVPAGHLGGELSVTETAAAARHPEGEILEEEVEVEDA